MNDNKRNIILVEENTVSKIILSVLNGILMILELYLYAQLHINNSFWYLIFAGISALSIYMLYAANSTIKKIWGIIDVIIGLIPTVAFIIIAFTIHGNWAPLIIIFYIPFFLGGIILIATGIVISCQGNSPPKKLLDEVNVALIEI